MAQFANEFKLDEIRAQPVPQIPRGTLIVIMRKSKSHEEMLFYINATHKYGWSRSIVLNQFELKAYERNLIETSTTDIIKFLQELGPGFSLVGKEYRLVTPTNKEFYIDLLMYHVKIHAYVVIEVKIGEFNPSDLGQLIFYVNAINKLEKTDEDNDTVGLLLCKDADSYVAKTSLNKSQMKLGISKYKIIEELPEYLEKRLTNSK